MEVPQQVNPFQNVLNTSLLLIRLSKYLPKVTQKNSREKQKGKSGKDETSLFGSKFYFFGKKMRGKRKKAKKSFGKFQFFQKKKFRGTKKKKTSQKGRSKIKSLYP